MAIYGRKDDGVDERVNLCDVEEQVAVAMSESKFVGCVELNLGSGLRVTHRFSAFLVLQERTIYRRCLKPHKRGTQIRIKVLLSRVRKTRLRLRNEIAALI